jgi:hypothetical protein
MVSYNGAKQAEPIVEQIDELNGYINELIAAIAQNNSQIWRLSVDYYDNAGTSHSILIDYKLNAADSAAIFNDIKNILSNDVNILNNELGAIT